MFRFSLLSIKTNLRNSAFHKVIIRNYATHRELKERVIRYTGSSSYGGNTNGNGWWRMWWAPVSFTAGVIAFDHLIIPHVVDHKVESKNVVFGLIALNVVGFIAWRIPAAPRQFMLRYGLLQKNPILFRRFQLIGSAFSHQNFWHLAINMFVLYQFATPVASIMGSSGFLGFYLDSCVLSSLGSMLIPFLLRRPQMIPSLGASGAVFSCLGVFCYLIPNAKLAFWFIPLPINAWNTFLLTIGFTTLATVSRRPIAFSGNGIDHAGHLSGALCGVAYGKYVQDKINKRRQLYNRRFR